MDLQQAIEFMKKAHGKQKDKGGKPYWYHPIRVMLRLGPNASEDMKYAALLHDVLEDTSCTIEDIRSAGFSEVTIRLVKSLTRYPGVVYRDYVNDIIRTTIQGSCIKLADLADNSSPARMDNLPEDMKGIVNRYRKTKEMILESLPHLSEFGIIEGDLTADKTAPFGF